MRTVISPITVAAMNGDRATLARCIDQGMDLNLCDRHGWTPLHWAASRGESDLVEALLVRGANPRLQTDCRQRAEDLAREAGHVALADFISAHPGRRGLRRWGTVAPRGGDDQRA